MARVTAAEVRQIRSSVLSGVRRAPVVGGFIAVVLDMFVFFPMRVCARLGVLKSRAPRRPRNGGGGFGTAGVGARLPVIPPSMSGAAALSIPVHRTTDDPA